MVHVLFRSIRSSVNSAGRSHSKERSIKRPQNLDTPECAHTTLHAYLATPTIITSSNASSAEHHRSCFIPTHRNHYHLARLTWWRSGASPGTVPLPVFLHKVGSDISGARTVERAEEGYAGCLCLVDSVPKKQRIGKTGEEKSSQQQHGPIPGPAGPRLWPPTAELRPSQLGHA